MSISKSEFSKYIKQFDFKTLFNEMGWNKGKTKEQSLTIDNLEFKLNLVAEKSGFEIFVCTPSIEKDLLPNKLLRKKIERKFTKRFQEHLIIFIDSSKKQQIWQLGVRKLGSPCKITETTYITSQDPQLLYQRAGGIFFTLDQEENITIIDVTKKVAENFQQNNEKVTKKFYESFRKKHSEFIKFIKGIEDKVMIDWYASLMLNRLMFCYFIQKKGFLNNDINYLRVKLEECKEKKGKNQFYSFYRDFLLVLFHKGLGGPEKSREKSTIVQIGKIPYLNGSLFDKHQIEKQYDKIDIDDQAFEKIFDFFDQYEWHLDSHLTSSGRDINPDVIGYIFEKYINDRAQMGAYYTKEDITDYISKNCIIPIIFDKLKEKYPKAFEDENCQLWKDLKENWDDYIYDAVKYGIPENKGIFDDLYQDIKDGFNPDLEKKGAVSNEPYLWEIRKSWNKPAPDNIGLPSETYREVIDRRKRYADIKEKLETGKIKDINDFITYNLNIRLFAQDAVENSQDPKFIKYFYEALSQVTILDPTCGSGAFLFAAMNILESLYQACIERMQEFIDKNLVDDNLTLKKIYNEILGKVKNHPNRQYFIYKSIILNNLYGTDIMKEATEIAKLRLFLKLAATVDPDYGKPNMGLEPLPDLDFNIRAGNTLVGYTSQKQIDNILASENVLASGVTVERKKQILEECDKISRTFKRYKEIQLAADQDYQDFKNAKEELNRRLKDLRDKLDDILYIEQYKGLDTKGKDYKKWLDSHRPFHWFAEFYEIIHENGGFDVVIGNPPYVENRKIEYRLTNYKTSKCGNIYAAVIERYFSLINHKAKSGMIIPHSSICTDRMSELIRILKNHGLWLSSYDIRPSKLFYGVDQRLLIYISTQNSSDIYSSSYHRWSADYREYLFSTIKYVANIKTNVSNSIIKADSEIIKSILIKCNRKKPLFNKIKKNGKIVYFHNAPRYFIRAMNNAPYFWNEKYGKKLSLHIKTLSFSKKEEQVIVCALLNSSLFYIWFLSLSDCRDLNMREIENMPCSLDDFRPELISSLTKITDELMKSYDQNKSRRETYYKTTGKVIYDEYYPKLSKHIIDQIDCLLAQHYNLTQQELDFIINYDIKYRMGGIESYYATE